MSAKDVVARPPGPVVDAARRLAEVERALGRLALLGSVARLVAAAPREACRATGLPRAMLSHLRGDRIGFASVSVAADPVGAADFARLARSVRPRLDRCAPEHEAAVRQVPVLVRDAPAAPGTFGPLIRASRAEAYVVAPVVCDGRAVTLLHADALGSGRAVDEVDRELLGTFAAALGWAMEGSPEGLGGAELVVELEGGGGPVALTAGEREVLRRGGIGDEEAAILRRLGVANRTEAFAVTVTNPLEIG